MENRWWTGLFIVIISIILAYEIFLVGINALNNAGITEVDYSILSFSFIVSLGLSLGVLSVINGFRLRNEEPNLSKASILLGLALLILNGLVYFGVWISI